MTVRKPLFAGLVFDEFGKPTEIAYVGEEPCYVVDDNGFKRHIPSEQIDRKVFESMSELIEGHEDYLGEQTAKMLGQDDIFSQALISAQLKNMENQIDNLLSVGIPEEVRVYMGMMGFKIKINIHGEIIDIEQPGMIDPNDE